MIRDWANLNEFEFGFRGGKKYLAEHVFKIKQGHAPDMKELRKNINDSYESIQCFLMPHPGQTVVKTKEYDGHWSPIDERFVKQLKILVPSILASENLTVKKIAGKEVTGESLYWDMQFYLQSFESELLPSPKSIYDATVTKFLQDMVSKYAAAYKEIISNGSKIVTTHIDFNILHLDSKKMVIDSYDNEKKIGRDSSITYYRNNLIDKIEEILIERNQTMYYKIETRMTKKKLEAQKNETIRQEIEIKDLKRKQKEAEKKMGEAQKETQKNFKKLDEQNIKIQNLTYTISQQQDEIEREREALKAREAQLKQDVANINTKLQIQKNQTKLLNTTLRETVKEREIIKKALEDNKKETAQKIQTLTATINIQQNEFNKELEIQRAQVKALAEKYKICDLPLALSILLAEIARKKEELNGIPQKAYLRQGDCYLCVGGTFDSSRRQIDCCNSKDAEKWLIEKTIYDTYTIKSISYGEYLYDAKYPHDGYLFLWRKSDDLEERYWTIDRVSSHFFTIKSYRGLYIYETFTKYYSGRWEIVNLG